MLLSRDTFRESVLARDGHKCVICGKHESEGVLLDAHHIIERRLWDDGGYYLDNGATLCNQGENGCHYRAETTEITVEDVRAAAGIENVVLPEDMYHDHVYDKWGNVILEDGRRSRGPLAYDESVQKVLEGHVEWSDRVKYPRTYHLPWSPGATNDDRMLKNTKQFEGNRVIVVRKIDGENFSGYRDGSHARSLDSPNHYTRNWAKNFWMQRAYNLPEGWRVCAENMWAVHSIKYENLPGYLIGFSVWDETNMCLSWDDTVTWFKLLDMPIVEVLYDGIWDEDAVRQFDDPESNVDEGYIVRNADAWHYKDFRLNSAKYVRKNHVATQKHWMYGYGKTHEQNQLAEDVQTS